MEITKKDVAHTAKLANMQVSEQESSVYEAQLEGLFKWVAELAEVNTDGVTLTNVNFAHIRQDIPVTNESLSAELRNVFGAQEADCAKVKKVL